MAMGSCMFNETRYENIHIQYTEQKKFTLIHLKMLSMV